MKIILFFLIFLNFNSFSQKTDISSLDFKRKTFLNNRINFLLPDFKKNTSQRTFIINRNSIEGYNVGKLIIWVSDEYTLFTPELYQDYKKEKFIISNIKKTGGKQIIKVSPCDYFKDKTFLQKAYLRNFDGTAISITIKTIEDMSDSLSFYNQIADSIIQSYDYGSRSILNIKSYDLHLGAGGYVDTFNIKIPDGYAVSRYYGFLSFSYKISHLKRTNNYILISHPSSCPDLAQLKPKGVEIIDNTLTKCRLNWKNVIWKNKYRINNYHSATLFSASGGVILVSIVSDNIRDFRKMKTIIKSAKKKQNSIIEEY